MVTTTLLSALAKTVRCSSDYGAKLDYDKQDEWQRKANGYRVTLRYRGRQMSLDYWMGSAHTSAPDSASVISSLLLDSSALDQSFEDFCSEFGYDTDSRKAEATYRACKSSGEKLRKLLGDDFETFRSAENDI